MHASIVERSNKRPNSFKITPEGDAFLRFAKQTLNTLDLAKDRIALAHATATNNIRIASVPSIALYDLDRGLARFKALCPFVNVQTAFRTPDEIYTAIHDGFDLGLVDFPVPQPSINFIRLGSDKLVVACNPRHPLPGGQAVSLKTLTKIKMVGLNSGPTLCSVVAKMFTDVGLEAQLVARFNSIEALKQAVKLGLGAAILPETTISAELANGTLVAVRLKPEPVRPLAVVYRKGKTLTPPMKQLIAILKGLNGTF